MQNPIEIFFSYAHEDEDLMNDVRRQLIVYERNGRILKWYDRQIMAGADWRQQIDWRLETAEIILLFVSPHFIESKYCYEVEGREALRRHRLGEARVIPIILRPCVWEESPFGRLQVLPRDGRPVSRWADRDEACLDVARGVMAAVDEVAAGCDNSASVVSLRPTGEATRHSPSDARLISPADSSRQVEVVIRTSLSALNGARLTEITQALTAAGVGRFEIVDLDAGSVVITVLTDSSGASALARMSLDGEVRVLPDPYWRDLLQPLDRPKPLEGDAAMRGMLEQYVAEGRPLFSSSGCYYRFSGAKLRNVNFAHARLFAVDLSGADLVGANLEGINGLALDLRRADLSSVALTGADLRGARLQEAVLREAQCQECDFGGADLRGAAADGADFSSSNFSYASLDGTSFDGADLSDCSFTGATLRGARLVGARLKRARLVKADVAGMIVDVSTYESAEWTPQDVVDLFELGVEFRRLQTDFPRAVLDALNWRQRDLPNYEDEN